MLKKAKEWLHYPIPMIWGLMALLLFLSFTLITQFQFNRVSERNLDVAKNNSAATAILAYQNAVTLNTLCLNNADMANRNLAALEAIVNSLDGTLSTKKLENLQETIKEIWAPVNLLECPTIEELTMAKELP